jgi:hypothetical protein
LEIVFVTSSVHLEAPYKSKRGVDLLIHLPKLRGALHRTTTMSTRCNSIGKGGPLSKALDWLFLLVMLVNKSHFTSK